MRSSAKARGGCAARRHEDLESNAQILGGDDTQVSWAKKKTEKKQYLTEQLVRR
jgi:hypothetical protein